MKVLLISANTLNAPYPVYPLGLDYVAAALPPQHRVKIADLNLIDLHLMGGLLHEFRPDVVGISLRNIDNTDTTAPLGFMAGYRQLVTVIRKNTHAPIVLGGAGFSIFPEKILVILGADYGIVGEGERLTDLLDALESKASVETIPGVVTLESPIGSPAPLERRLRRCFNPAHDHLSYYLRHGGMLNIQTKRGCPFRCIYCTYPHIEGHRFRLMDPESVGRTARQLQEAGAKYFFIADSAFNADMEHSLAVAEQFRKNGVSIPWGAFLAPLQMPPNYFKSLVKAGLTHIEFGTESLSNQVLRAYAKPFGRDEILQAHESAVQAGLKVAHYFLLGGPGETANTLETTLTSIDKLKKSVLFLFCGMRIYPHTSLFDRALGEGRITASQDLLAPVFYETPAISRDEIIGRVKRAANRRINWVIGSGGSQISELLQRMYKRGYTGPLWEYLIR